MYLKGGVMDHITGIYGLMLQYPDCADFIASCTKAGEMDKLWDFILALK